MFVSLHTRHILLTRWELSHWYGSAIGPHVGMLVCEGTIFGCPIRDGSSKLPSLSKILIPRSHSLCESQKTWTWVMCSKQNHKERKMNMCGSFKRSLMWILAPWPYCAQEFLVSKEICLTWMCFRDSKLLDDEAVVTYSDLVKVRFVVEYDKAP